MLADWLIALQNKATEYRKRQVNENTFTDSLNMSMQIGAIQWMINDVFGFYPKVVYDVGGVFIELLPKR